MLWRNRSVRLVKSRCFFDPHAAWPGHDLAEAVSESIFNIPRLVDATLHQRFDPLLGGRSKLEGTLRSEDENAEAA